MIHHKINYKKIKQTIFLCILNIILILFNVHFILRIQKEKHTVNLLIHELAQTTNQTELLTQTKQQVARFSAVNEQLSHYYHAEKILEIIQSTANQNHIHLNEIKQSSQGSVTILAIANAPCAILFLKTLLKQLNAIYIIDIFMHNKNTEILIHLPQTITS